MQHIQTFYSRCTFESTNTHVNTSHIHTGDLIELIGTFPHENFDYQNTNQFEEPVIIYTEPNRPKPHYNRPKPDENRPKPNNHHFFQVKPSYHESTTQTPDDFYTPDQFVQSNAGGDDDYVPVHTNGHKLPRPSYPGENI